MGKILFFNEDIRYRLRKIRLLRAWLFAVFHREGFEVGAVNFIFCSDRYLYDLNVKYLAHDTLTDTITFSYYSDNEPVSGDVFISYERVKENAKALGIAVEEEVLRLLVHGALHLCGYNDKSVEEKRIMTKKEDDYMLLYRELSV